MEVSVVPFYGKRTPDVLPLSVGRIDHQTIQPPEVPGDSSSTVQIERLVDTRDLAYPTLSLLRRHSDRPDHETEGGSEEASGGDTKSRIPSTTCHWQDLLISDLPPTKFDAVLKSVLHSDTEMDRIKGLSEKEFQSVVDVLGRVSTLFFVPTVPPSPTTRPPSAWRPVT